jgi:nicotinamidase-related amidase/alkylated DNA repair dioxygenase AlkB
MPEQPTPAPAPSALLVIDAQNDFLTPGGAFSKRHCDAEQLAQTIVWLARAARGQGRSIAWIRSVYGEIEGSPDELRGLTHASGGCCARGSWGAELVAPVEAVLREGAGRGAEWAIEKRWYSAFRDTELHPRLAAAGATRLILCGVATNVCVLETAREARALGYEIEVVEDATTAGSSSKHIRALRAIEALGGRIRRAGELFSESGEPFALTGLGAGGSTLWCGALRDCIADDASGFEAIAREVGWSAMFHRGGEVPRRVAIQGTRSSDGAEPLYRHPVDEQPALQAFTPHVDAVRRAVEARMGQALNHCLLQLYRDGRDWIGEHSDKTLDLVRGSSIVNVSLGQMRTMVLRPKRGNEEDARTQKVPLPHGSFLVMDAATNQAFYHAIKQQGEGPHDGPRISLTFRSIGTWMNPATGAVWGVGALAAGREEAEARALARRALPAPLREATMRAEAERMLRLFREENIDPSFDVAAYRPGFDALDLRGLTETA